MFRAHDNTGSGNLNHYTVESMLPEVYLAVSKSRLNLLLFMLPR